MLYSTEMTTVNTNVIESMQSVQLSSGWWRLQAKVINKKDTLVLGEYATFTEAEKERRVIMLAHNNTI